MGKYFGRDGFRGEAGITLTTDHAYKVGRFLGWYYNALRERNGDTDPARIVISARILVGVRYVFEYSLVAGLRRLLVQMLICSTSPPHLLWLTLRAWMTSTAAS